MMKQTLSQDLLDQRRASAGLENVHRWWIRHYRIDRGSLEYPGHRWEVPIDSLRHVSCEKWFWIQSMFLAKQRDECKQRSFSPSAYFTCFRCIQLIEKIGWMLNQMTSKQGEKTFQFLRQPDRSKRLACSGTSETRLTWMSTDRMSGCTLQEARCRRPIRRWCRTTVGRFPPIDEWPVQRNNRRCDLRRYSFDSATSNAEAREREWLSWSVKSVLPSSYVLFLGWRVWERVVSRENNSCSDLHEKQSTMIVWARPSTAQDHRERIHSCQSHRREWETEDDEEHARRCATTWCAAVDPSSTKDVPRVYTSREQRPG